ncbi:uncharacterized protein [Bos mutus]|uniref:uncharacterized protein n=1 Tax=Bos mutus TaxID=72004 RepID=UPI0038B68078
MARDCRDQRPAAPRFSAHYFRPHLQSGLPEVFWNRPQRRCCGAQFWYREIERDYGSREDWGNIFRSLGPVVALSEALLSASVRKRTLNGHKVSYLGVIAGSEKFKAPTNKGRVASVFASRLRPVHEAWRWLRRAHEVQQRGATPCPRSGAEAGRTPCPKGGSQEELPHVRGQGQRPRVPGYGGAGTAEKSYSSLGSGAAAGRSYPASEVRGGVAVAWRSYPMPLCTRPGAVARRTNPTSKERWLHGHKRA